MKSRAVLSAALAAGVLYFAAAASSVQAFDLLDRMMTSHGGCGCEAAPSCCEPDPCCQKRVGLLQRLHARQQSCCEPACGVEVACDPCHDACCAPKRPSLLDRLRASRHSCASACDPKCGVDPHCGAEQACCDPCAPKRPGLLTRLFSGRSSCGSACEPKCGVEPTCCH